MIACEKFKSAFLLLVQHKSNHEELIILFVGNEPQLVLWCLIGIIIFHKPEKTTEVRWNSWKKCGASCIAEKVKSFFWKVMKFLWSQLHKPSHPILRTYSDYQILCHKLCAMALKFWWGETCIEKKIYWRKWKIFCHPKSQGCMSFQNMIKP